MLSLTIEIAVGQNEKIMIYEGDSPDAVAQGFCKKYGLNHDLKSVLAQQI